MQMGGWDQAAGLEIRAGIPCVWKGGSAVGCGGARIHVAVALCTLHTAYCILCDGYRLVASISAAGRSDAARIRSVDLSCQTRLAGSSDGAAAEPEGLLWMRQAWQEPFFRSAACGLSSVWPLPSSSPIGRPLPSFSPFSTSTMSQAQIPPSPLAPPEILAEFRQSIEEIDGVRQGDWDDYALSRFLVARQLNIKNAHAMLKGYVQQWNSRGIPSWPKHGIDKDVPPLQNVRGFECYPDSNWDPDHPASPSEFQSLSKYIAGGCFHKIDKLGFPIYVERTGMHDTRNLATYVKPEEMINWHVRNNEFLFNGIMKECSEKAGRHIGKHVVIFDCKGMGFHQFNLTAIGLLRGVGEFDANYYPERLERLFVVNTPSFFSRAWMLIKIWLDKNTLEKIQIIHDDGRDVLLKYIDAENLPEFMGGKCTCSHMEGGCVPQRGNGGLQS
ncbi:CRAL-TRIO domain-containing protein [Polychytrium aggregatum]|uniref:CRAL-TRIO domain-containing protein n=1 Tax=Polychytrium aggregatum TaxID=110093 RepID=UPI0022FDFE98|nr:CRAL-TRIO domain-containing protein [Polychytrium aggregatum]KAI9206529.1 CRAL-TRIO domain-containing protein [Polychytrium aggregatum]